MPDLPENYKRLIALGIDKSANLSDLNDMTDRGRYPLKPWTAAKTVSTMKLIKDFSITDEETLVNKFQELSKVPLEILTERVFQHQLNYFGYYKYDIETIFKYTYCCIVINSLQGNATELKFDSWAMKNNIKIKNPPALLDQKYHTDRLQLDMAGNLVSFISIKPNSFCNNFLQYVDVFAGLQMLSEVKGIPWKIYYREDETFQLIMLNSLEDEDQKKIKKLVTLYSAEERAFISEILRSL